MIYLIAAGLAIPFLGTSLGSSFVFFMKRVDNGVSRVMNGTAAGVMCAASIFSLLFPSKSMAAEAGQGAFPVMAGFLTGMLSLLAFDLICDGVLPNTAEDRRTLMTGLAVTLHNLPEGMAIGVSFAGWMSGQSGVTLAAAFALSVGIAVQNVPEGAVISLPLGAKGMKKGRAFLWGVLSGAVEPVGGALTVLLAHEVRTILPFLLSYAAGAMFYVILCELVPDMIDPERPAPGVLSFTGGFFLMMLLDLTLG